MMRETIPAEELLTKARAVGQYYGFTPLSVVTAASRGTGTKKKVGYPEAVEALQLDPTGEMVASFLKQCVGAGYTAIEKPPRFIWHTNVTPGRPAQKKAVVQFHALGADRPITDAVVIRAAIALARDLFHEEPVVRLNSMGDKETRARYARELAAFFKKRASVLPEDCVTCAKRSVLEAAELMISRESADDLPAPTEHLSDASRKRFEDLLEFLEMTETPYELAKNLISRGNVWNDLCFEILVGGRRVAWGSRYGDLAKHFFPGGFGSATVAVLQMPCEGMVEKKLPTSRLRFSFVHIGDEAKRLSLRLAEDFRKARVPLAQHIGVESLTEQLHLAERSASPYLLIMGRKEALESSAILRNRETQEETVLPLLGLAERLKTIV